MAVVTLVAACVDLGEPVSPAPKDGVGTEETSIPVGTGKKVVVELVNQAFSPKQIEIERGTTVVWVNKDATMHHIIQSGVPASGKPPRWKSGKLFFGDEFSYTYDEAGTFLYFCVNHSTTMRDATVTVK